MVRVSKCLYKTATKLFINLAKTLCTFHSKHHQTLNQEDKQWLGTNTVKRWTKLKQ